MTATDDAQVLLLQAELNTRPQRPEWMVALADRLVTEAIEARKTLAALSPKQMEVAKLLAKGFTSNEVGELLKMERGTVDNHVYHALRTLDLRWRAELIVMVAKAGLS